MTVKEELLKLGARMSKFDEALFIWRSEGELHGLIGCHVDDFIDGGSVLFNQQVIDKIKEMFEISQEDDCMFKYVGQEVKQLTVKLPYINSSILMICRQLKYLSIRTSITTLVPERMAPNCCDFT